MLAPHAPGGVLRLEEGAAMATGQVAAVATGEGAAVAMATGEGAATGPRGRAPVSGRITL